MTRFDTIERAIADIAAGKAVVVDGHTIMVPVHTGAAAQSPFETERSGTADAVARVAGARLPEEVAS